MALIFDNVWQAARGGVVVNAKGIQRSEGELKQQVALENMIIALVNMIVALENMIVARENMIVALENMIVISWRIITDYQNHHKLSEVTRR